LCYWCVAGYVAVCAGASGVVCDADGLGGGGTVVVWVYVRVRVGGIDVDDSGVIVTCMRYL